MHSTMLQTICKPMHTVSIVDTKLELAHLIVLPHHDGAPSRVTSVGAADLPQWLYHFLC